MAIAAIALGSNLGDRARNLSKAAGFLTTIGHILTTSAFYDTAPVGLVDQPRFLNAAVLLETDLPPLALLRSLLEIEQRLGRDRESVPAKGPRTIDLDLILYDLVILETPELTLPHPAMRERVFVLAPLAEIAPSLIDPVTGLSIAALLRRTTETIADASDKEGTA